MFFWKEELYIAKSKVVPIGVLGSLRFYVWFLWLKHLWYHKSCLMNVLPSNTPQGILYSLPITAFVSADNSTSSQLRKQNSSWSCLFIKNGWSWTTSVAWTIQTYSYILQVITHKWELVTVGVFCIFKIIVDDTLVCIETALYLLLQCSWMIWGWCSLEMLAVDNTLEAGN